MSSNKTLAIMAVGFILVGCGGYNTGLEEGATNEAEEAVGSDNGLKQINGLPSVNGLWSSNGLGDLNGLPSVNGLQSTDGLGPANGLSADIDWLEAPEARATTGYLVKCALSSEQSITKKYNGGEVITFTGELGVAPEWLDGACNNDCQERVSACLLAHLNTTGVHVPIFLVGSAEAFPSIGPSLDMDNFPRQEAAFYGNLFISPPVAYQCEGGQMLPNFIDGRAGSPGDKQYADTGRCVNVCNEFYGIHNGDEPDGFAACQGFRNVLTVYTQ